MCICMLFILILECHFMKFDRFMPVTDSLWYQMHPGIIKLHF